MRKMLRGTLMILGVGFVGIMNLDASFNRRQEEEIMRQHLEMIRQEIMRKQEEMIRQERMRQEEEMMRQKYTAGRYPKR